MAYTILNTDGSVLLLLADGRIDQSTTSLSLIGKNTNSFGQYVNENFIQLLANSANTSGNPPRNPLKGQLWYDTTIRKMKVYDNGFKTVGGVTVSATYPIELSTGDLWFDSVNMQLKILNGASLYTVGPAYPKSAGDNGLIIPGTSVKELVSELPQQVTVLKNYGNSVGIVSHKEFQPSIADNASYFTTSTVGTIQQRVVNGLTINGDINYTGKMTQKHLSLFIDVDILANTIEGIGSDISIWDNVGAQNNAIRTILTHMYPPATDDEWKSYVGYQADSDHYPPPAAQPSATFYESGVPRGAQGADIHWPSGTVCKVLVRYSQGGTNATSGGKDGNAGQGYQIRRFAISDVGAWYAVSIEELSL